MLTLPGKVNDRAACESFAVPFKLFSLPSPLRKAAFSAKHADDNAL